MSTGNLLLLQSMLVSAQIFNAGLAAIAHVNPVLTLGISAVVGGFQFFVQHAGNQTVPPPPVKKD